jgi:hypothetical protein
VTAWSHPLVLIAVSGNAHVDTLALPLLTAWVLLAERGALGRSALIGAAAITVKLFPGVLLLATIPKHRRRAVIWLGLGVGLAALSWLSAIPIGAKGFGSLSTYATRWTFNGSVAPMVEAIVHSVCRLAWSGDSVQITSLAEWARTSGRLPVVAGHEVEGLWVNRWQVAGMASRITGVVALGATFAMCLRARCAPIRALSAMLLALFLTAPVMHPWYALWLLIPALASHNRIALLWTSSIVFAFYAPAAVLDGERWTDPIWIRCLQYTPIFAGLVVAALAAVVSRPLTVPRAAP